jgi:competence protein ComEA
MTEPSPLSPDAMPGRRPWSDLTARLQAGDAPVAGAVVVAVVAVVAGFLWYQAGVRGAGEAGALPAPVPTPSKAAITERPLPAAPAAAEVVVHVAGAVHRPGLHRLAGGSRVADALAAAGGAALGADTDRLNLAAKVVDGQRIAVPRRGEPPPPLVDGTAAAALPTGPGTTPSPAAVIDLNAATQAELETLPGVGPATAQRILAERERRGGFKTVQDLRRVPGIGERRFAELRHRVRV